MWNFKLFQVQGNNILLHFKRNVYGLISKTEAHLFIICLEYQEWHCIIMNLFWINGSVRIPLQWHHNELMASQITSLTLVYSIVYSRRRSKKTSKLHVTGLCEGNSPVTGEFPTQRASNAENVSIWWRHHAKTHPHNAIRMPLPCQKVKTVNSDIFVIQKHHHTTVCPLGKISVLSYNTIIYYRV